MASPLNSWRTSRYSPIRWRGCSRLSPNSVLVAHNARFDIGFLDMELTLCGRPPLGHERAIDTLAMARSRHPGAKHSLDALCTRYGVDRSHRIKHGALLDAQLLAQVYVELTGGRQIGLDLMNVTVVQGSDTLRADAGRGGADRLFRPARIHGPAAAELERHAAFIARMDDALWKSTGG